MTVARWILASLLALISLWCLLWLDVFVAFRLASDDGSSAGAYLMLGAWAVAFFLAALLVQPLRPRGWRRGSAT